MLPQNARWLSCVLCSCLALTSHADEVTNPVSTPELAESAETAVSFGGPSGVSEQLEASRRLLSPTDNLTFGGDYFLFGQSASESPGESRAVSGVGRLYGRWDLLGSGKIEIIGVGPTVHLDFVALLIQKQARITVRTAFLASKTAS